MEGCEPAQPHQRKRARVDDAASQRYQRARHQWGGVLAVCQHRRRRRAKEATPSAWDALPDEAAWCILALCAQRDICALAATCRRMHRLCADDALWLHVYLRDFPPCRRACLLVLGDTVLHSPLSPFDYARRRLDRLLDPDDDLAAPDPMVPCALWDIDHLTAGVSDAVAHCVHHWPAVIATCGYRWACASMVPLAPHRMPQRRFYPIDAPDARGAVVGCCVATSASVWDGDDDEEEEPYGANYTAPYRGQVEARGYGFVPHGFGTISAYGATTLPWTCRSGAWTHGQILSEGPCALWQRAIGLPDVTIFMHCRAGDLVRHTDAPGQRECGVGVLLSSRGDIATGCMCHPDGDPARGATRVALLAQGGRADRHAGTLTAMTTSASLRHVATHLCSALPRGIDGVGVLRVPSQKVAFAGSFVSGEPCSGKTWDSDGRLLYAGSFKSDAVDCGVLYAADGTTLDGSWVRGWRDDASPARHIAATHLTASHPDGATVVWKDWMRVDGRVRPRVADFWWASLGGDGNVRERPWPSADWDVLVLPPGPAQSGRASVRPLLADAGLAVARSMHLLHADEIVADLAFWPRPNASGGPRPHLDDTLAFVSRMAATRPTWARCRRVVLGMYAPL